MEKNKKSTPTLLGIASVGLGVSATYLLLENQNLKTRIIELEDELALYRVGMTPEPYLNTIKMLEEKLAYTEELLNSALEREAVLQNLLKTYETHIKNLEKELEAGRV